MKTIIYLLYITLILPQTMNSLCEIGCQKCDPDKSICLVCDTTNNYHLSKGKCISKKVENCKMYDSDKGNCQMCVDGFFLEKIMQKCVSNDFGIDIKNCQSYLVLGECVKCKTLYFLEANVCRDVSKKIEACLFYKGPSKCDECERNFVLNFLKDQCLAVEKKDENCATLSTLLCVGCKGQSIRDLNYLKKDIEQDLKSEDPNIHELVIHSYLKESLEFEDGCVSGGIENCASYDSAELCASCNTGYFLNDNICYLFPKEKIANCSKYLTETKCKECFQFFYLKSEINCAPIEKIENCELYSSTADETICLKCWPSHFLQSNTCIERKNFPDQCSNYSKTADICTSCSDDNTITADGKKCLPSINNCQQYLNSTFESLSLTCQQCNSFYYLENSECKLGSITNCKTYAASSEDCNECQDSYYLKNNLCLKHNDIIDCKIYDKNTQDKCLECENQTVLMSKTTNCKKVFIEGCAEYSNMSLCLSCKDGYNKVNNYECNKLEPFLNCIRAVNGVCEKCGQNFLLKNGSCTRPYNYEVKYCAKTNITGDFSDHENVNCEICLPDALPLNYKNHFVCLENSEMEILRGTFLIPNCLGYQKSGTSSYSCVKCEENFVLKDGLCKNNCGDSDIIQRFNFVEDSSQYSFEKKDFCVTKAPAECLLKTLGTTDGTTITSQCLNSLDTYYQKIDLTSTGEMYAEAKDVNDNITSKNVFSLPIPSNSLKNDGVLKKGILNSDKVVEDCKYYYELGESTLGCSVCEFGKYGRILNWEGIEFCNKYDDDNRICEKCKHGYYDEDAEDEDNKGKKCVKNDIINCLRFSLVDSKCLSCKKGFYLEIDQLSCIENTKIENCEFLSRTSNKCIKCKKGYSLTDKAVNKCQIEIINCLIHIYTKVKLECEECKNYYFPKSDGTECIKGTKDRCWKYKQDRNNSYSEDTCEKYINEFLFKRTNKCLAKNTIPGCLTYDSSDDSLANANCTVCNEDTHFLTGNYCCKYGDYLSNTDPNTCSASEVENCKKNTSTVADICEECNADYELFEDDKKCCENGSYYSGACKKDFDLSLSNDKCSIYDQFNKICLFCNKATHYLNKESEICCLLGKYFKDDKCEDITEVENCNKYNDTDKCTECGKDDDENELTTLSGKYCCPATQYDSGDGCVNLPNKCKEVKETDPGISICKTCDDNYYMVPPSNVCCEIGKEYDNGDGSCSPKIMDSCNKFDKFGKCLECSDNKIVLNNGLKCCVETEYFDGTNCITQQNNLNIFENCVQVDVDDSNKCKVCVSKYYLHLNTCVKDLMYLNKADYPSTPAEISGITSPKFINCNKINDNLDECTECIKGFFLVDGSKIYCCKPKSIYINDNCVPIQEFSLNCAYFDTTTKKCAVIGDNVQCAGNEDFKFYVDLPVNLSTQRRCCKEGEFFDDNSDVTLKKCIPIEDDTAATANCIRTNLDGTTCKTCKQDFLFFTTCVAKLPKCVSQSNATTCTKCEVGYILNHTTANKCTAYDSTVSGVNYTKHCSKVDDPSSNTTCTECDSFSYDHTIPVNICCPLGYYYDGIASKCKKIKNKYCAKSDDGIDCLECFISKDYCTVDDNFKWTIRNSDYSLTHTKEITNIKILVDADLPENSDLNEYKENYLSNDTKKCCPLGKYYNLTDEICKDISELGIKNCFEYNGTECTKCKDEYKLESKFCCRYDEEYDSSSKSCVKKSSNLECKDGDGFYLSNGKCCKENFFYDTNLSRCIPLFDVNCKQSDSRTDCNLCKTDYKLEANFSTVVEQILETPDHCKNLEEKHYVRFCKEDDWFVENIVDYTKFNVLINDCQSFNFTNQICNSCVEGSSKADGTYCCAKNYFAYEEKCREMENFVENCANYDHDTRKCLECKNNHHLAEGVCCPSDKYLNIKTFKCDIEKATCKTFDIKTGVCTACLDNNYFSNYNCCSFGTYYDLEKKSCLTISKKGLEECKMLGNNGLCDECFDNTYRHKGYCCPKGKYWKTDTDSDKSECKESTKFLNCEKFDIFDNCLECKENTYFSNSKCCPYKQWYNSAANTCVTKPKLLDCKKIDDEGDKCLECDSGYLSNHHCCEVGEVWTATKGEDMCITILKNPHCLKVDETTDSNCLLCEVDYYVSNNKCCREEYYYKSTSNSCEFISDRDTNFVIRASGVNGDTKLKCKTGYILEYNDTNCITFNSETHVPNCYKIGDSDDKCLLCHDDYYKSNNKCCKDGEFYNSDGCKPISTSDLDSDQKEFCAQIETTGCSKCKKEKEITHYVSNALECVEYGKHWLAGTGIVENIENCSEANDATSCLVCETDYMLDNSTSDKCVAPPVASTPSTSNDVPDYLKFCSYEPNSDSTLFPDKCAFCYPKDEGEGTKQQRYKTNGSCCEEGYYFDNSTSFTCIPIDPSDGFDNCTKINDNKCEACESDFYLTNDNCCKEGFHWDYNNGFSACVAITGEGLEKCKQLDSSNKCNTDAGCLDNSNHYITQGHCCPDGKFWNTIFATEKCDTITLTDCLKLDPTDNKKCKTCVTDNATAKYISNDFCCDEEKYFPGEQSTCDDIENRLNCKKLSDNKCDQTGDCEVNLDHPECCGKEYYTDDGICKPYPSCTDCFVCSKVKADGECTACSDGYLTNGRCCPLTKYWNGTDCTDTGDNLIIGCDEYEDSDGIPTNCSKCSNTEEEVRNGKCCKISEFYLSSISACVDIGLYYEVCLNMDSNGNCVECKDGKYVSKGICCEEGKFYDSDEKKCADIPDASFCLEQNGTDCIKCKSTYYLNSTIKKCCLISVPDSGADCDTDKKKFVENCNGFDASKKCSSCTDGNILYPTGENNDTVCCAEKEFYDKNLKTCQSLEKSTERCTEFDQANMKCTTCNSNYFLGNNFCCLLDSEYWDINEKICKEKNLESCLEQVQIKNDEDIISNICNKCTEGNDNYKEGCCPEGNYWDKSKSECISNPISNCKKYNGLTFKCLDCIDNNEYYEKNNRCCPHGRWWNNYESSCQQMISNCKIYKDIETPLLTEIVSAGTYSTVAEYLKGTVQCEECLPDFFLLINKKSCCKENQVYFSEGDTDQCRTKPLVTEVFENCIKFDIKTLKCLKCEDDYYESSNICCKNGQVKDSDTKLCKAISLSTEIDGCDQVENDFENAKCTHCEEGKFINFNKLACLVYPDCLVFHNTQGEEKCTQCKKGFYLSDGFCCSSGNKRKGTANECVAIDSGLNCLKWNKSNCTECKGFAYPVLVAVADSTDISHCCTKGNFCPDDSTKNKGLIDNCEIYGISTSDCKKCNSVYALTELDDSILYCYPIFTPNCKYQKSTVDTYNKLTCTECKDQFFLDNLTTEEEVIQDYGDQIDGCIGFDNTELLNTSTLKCEECGDNKYLDISDLDAISCKERSASGINKGTDSSSWTNCKEPYDINKDECRVCKDGFYLNSDNLCKPYDDGDGESEYECLFYKENSTDDICALCGSAAYEIFNYDEDNTSWEKTCPTVASFSTENDTPSPPKYFKAYVEQCIKNEECLPDYLNGLSLELQKYFSCHKCSDATKIPFVGIQGGTESLLNTGLQRFNILTENDNTLNEYNADEINYSSQCLKKDLTQFAFKSNTASTTFPANCALGVVNADLAANDTDSASESPADGLSVYCAACEPGYAPTYSTKKLHVYQCVLISNCDVKGGAFNQCDECASTHAFEYNDDGINYEICVSNSSVTNCFAYNTVNYNCEYCKKGYSKNKEGKCEIINAPNCMENKMAFNKSYPLKDIKIAILMGDFGCSKCSENFSGLYKSENEYVCTESTYIKAKSYIPSNPVFDINCLQYSNNEEIITCHKCSPTTILSTSGICFPASSLQNCLLAESATSCKTCINTHVIVNNDCVLKEIKNCSIYTQPAELQTCNTCQEKYYLSDNKCLEGNIKNCKVYGSNGSFCNTCEDGYERILVKDGAHYCIPVTTHENCVDFNNSSFQNNFLTCQECEADYLLENLSSQVNVCNPYSLVTFCKSYDQGLEFGTSTFICNECINGYYLSERECILRTIEIEFCLVYEISQQLCNECEKEYYPKIDKTECLINPAGVQGCAIFSDEDNCIKCKSGYYLEANSCKIVLTENLVEGCINYTDAKTCNECETEKVLNTNTNNCETPNIPNCLVYEDLTNCLTCEENFGILITAGKKNCGPIQEIANCATYKKDSPFPCSTCNTNFYLENSECKEANPLIENCLDYESNDQCSKCQDLHVLSKDKKKCILYTFSGNCASFKEETNPFCVLCKPGYLLNDQRNCIADSTFDLKSNCLFFNSTNSKDCEMCQIGYYQNSDRECVANDFDKNKNVTDASDDNGGNGSGNQQDGSGSGSMNFDYFGLLILIFVMFE